MNSLQVSLRALANLRVPFLHVIWSIGKRCESSRNQQSARVLIVPFVVCILFFAARDLGQVLKSLGLNPTDTELKALIRDVDVNGKTPSLVMILQVSLHSSWSGSRILVRRAKRSFDPRGALGPKFAQNIWVFFPSKLPENCMILNKIFGARGPGPQGPQGPQGPLDPFVLLRVQRESTQG